MTLFLRQKVALKFFSSWLFMLGLAASTLVLFLLDFLAGGLDSGLKIIMSGKYRINSMYSEWKTNFQEFFRSRKVDWFKGVDADFVVTFMLNNLQINRFNLSSGTLDTGFCPKGPSAIDN